MALEFEIIPVTPFQQNCTLLWCSETRQAALVDPGGEIPRLIARVTEHNLELKKIFLTHGHLDHVGATAQLQKELELPVEGPHLGDRFWIEGLTQQCQMFGFPLVDTFEPDRWLDEGDEVTIGNETLQVIHTPGHTPGHIVFYHIDSKLIQVGDVIFKGSIGRTDFPKGNHETLLASIKQKLFKLPDAVRLIPGHGPMSSIGDERQHNPFVADKNFG